MAEASVTLRPVPLTPERFAPYGDVIESSRDRSVAMNEARFDRFDEVCNIDIDGSVAVGVARCRTATALPLLVEKLERHTLGSQAFMPLQHAATVIVVAPPGEDVDVSELRAFATRPGQGFNYRRGTWHMPLIAFVEGHEFLVIDRAGDDCEELVFDELVTLEAP